MQWSNQDNYHAHHLKRYFFVERICKINSFSYSKYLIQYVSLFVYCNCSIMFQNTRLYSCCLAVMLYLLISISFSPPPNYYSQLVTVLPTSMRSTDFLHISENMQYLTFLVSLTSLEQISSTIIHISADEMASVLRPIVYIYHVLFVH